MDFGQEVGQAIRSITKTPVKQPHYPSVQENMFFTSTDGFSWRDNFVVCLKDVVQVVKPRVPEVFQSVSSSLTFHSVTLCPIQTKLIKVDLLTPAERKGLNECHARVRNTLLPLLDPADELTRNWVIKETQEI